MTSVRPRLLAAVPLLAVALALAPSSAPASLPDSCNGVVDVALGAPKADVAGQADAGQVTIVFEPDGASPSLGNANDVVITEDSLAQAYPSLPAMSAGDNFGAAVITGYEDATPGCSMVAVGAPGADGGKGRVYVFVLDEDGIVGTPAVITQDTDGVADTAEAGDRFGTSLLFGGDLFVRWLAVGSPREDVGTIVDAGMVHVLPYTGDAGVWGAGSTMLRQGAAAGGVAEAGDHFGAALGPGRSVWSLWAGSPEEDIGTVADGGLVTNLPGSYDATSDSVKLPGSIGGVVSYSQDTAGVPGEAEAGDHFGSVLSALVGMRSTDRQPVIGDPLEGVGSASDAGVVYVAYQDGTWGSFRQGAAGFGGTAESWDHFGDSLSTFGTTLLVGSPYEDVGAVVDAGVIHVMNAVGVVPKLSAASGLTFGQDTSGVVDSAATGDKFGTSVAFGVDGAVVGVPGQAAASSSGAGAIAFLPYKSGVVSMGLTATGNQVFVAGDAGFPSGPQPGAGFGAVAYSVTQ